MEERTAPLLNTANSERHSAHSLISVPDIDIRRWLERKPQLGQPYSRYSRALIAMANEV